MYTKLNSEAHNSPAKTGCCSWSLSTAATDDADKNQAVGQDLGI